MRHALWLLFALPTFAQEQPKQDERKISPEELARRKEEAFKDAAEAYKQYKVWTGRVKISESNPFEDKTAFAVGTIWVKAIDEETRWLYWDTKVSMDPEGQMALEDSRSLYKGTDLSVTHESSEKKSVDKYALSKLDVLLPQILLREGFVKKLEENFEVEIHANAKYQKTKPDAVDWGHLGFKDEEEFKAWWEKVQAKGSGGSETSLKEDRPFKDREDKFDKDNPRNKQPGTEGNEFQLFYIIYLHPSTPALKREIRKVTWTLRPGDFLPVSLLIERTDDVHVTVQFESLRKDPEPEVKDDRFRLDTVGFTERWPQKE